MVAGGWEFDFELKKLTKATSHRRYLISMMLSGAVATEPGLQIDHTRSTSPLAVRHSDAGGSRPQRLAALAAQSHPLKSKTQNG